MSAEAAPPSAKAARPGIQSITRTAEILRLLAGERRRVGVAELARTMCLPKGTVYGILRTLQLEGFLEQDSDSGKYQVGPALLAIGFAYLQSSRLRSAALNVAQALAARSGESVRVGALHRGAALIVHRVAAADANQYALDVGALAPAHATALGKALLAQDGGLFAHDGAEELPRYTPATVTSGAHLRREIKETSSRGWARAIGELSPGVASIAAPVLANSLSSPAAIEIEGPIERLCEGQTPRTELVYAVIESARIVSRELGEPGW